MLQLILVSAKGENDAPPICKNNRSVIVLAQAGILAAAFEEEDQQSAMNSNPPRSDGC